MDRVLSSEGKVEEAARALLKAQETRVACAPVTETFGSLSVVESYAVQARVMAWRGEQGLHGRPARRVGRKIGLTSRAIQEWLGVREPDFGVLLDDMVILDGMGVPPGLLLQPRAEAEIAFVLGRDLKGPGVTAADVLRATEFLVPAIEIIDSRIREWKITFEDTIADNASSGLFVLGNQAVKPTMAHLRCAGMALYKGGEVVSTGAGAACLGHPVNAMVWLANRLADFGEGLGEGDVVLSGALGPVTPVRPGDHLRAKISGLGSVGVYFEKESR